MDETLQLIERIRSGESAAESELYARIYEELRARAGRLMRKQPEGHTLQPTALVNEAWLKLTHAKKTSWENRAHFLRTATRAMQSVLVDHARARLAEKRGGDPTRVDLMVEPSDPAEPAWRLLALNEAMIRLEEVDENLHHVAQCRLFGGLSHPEIHRLLGIPLRTVERSWKAARAWLERELEGC